MLERERLFALRKLSAHQGTHAAYDQQIQGNEMWLDFSSLLFECSTVLLSFSAGMAVAPGLAAAFQGLTRAGTMSGASHLAFRRYVADYLANVTSGLLSLAILAVSDERNYSSSAQQVRQRLTDELMVVNAASAVIALLPTGTGGPASAAKAMASRMQRIARVFRAIRASPSNINAVWSATSAFHDRHEADALIEQITTVQTFDPTIVDATAEATGKIAEAWVRGLAGSYESGIRQGAAGEDYGISWLVFRRSERRAMTEMYTERTVNAAMAGYWEGAHIFYLALIDAATQLKAQLRQRATVPSLGNQHLSP